VVNLSKELAESMDGSYWGITSSLAKLSENHRSTRVSLGRFQNEGVASNSGQRNRP